MVDVGTKPESRREAVAVGEIRVSSDVMRLLKTGRVSKGDVFAVSRIAGILAAKKVPELIPLCHPLKLDEVRVSFRLNRDRIFVRAEVKSEGKTGVEMEALTAVSVASLTIYDMCKSADKGMTLGPIHLAGKSGGRSGTYVRPGGQRRSVRWL